MKGEGGPACVEGGRFARAWSPGGRESRRGSRDCGRQAGRAEEGFVRHREGSELRSESNRKPAEVLSRGITPSVFYFIFLNQGDDSASKGWDSFLENLILKGQQAPGCPGAWLLAQCSEGLQ